MPLQDHPLSSSSDCLMSTRLSYTAIDVAVISTWLLDAANASNDMYGVALHLRHRDDADAIRLSPLLLLLRMLHCSSSLLFSPAASELPKRRSRLC